MRHSERSFLILTGLVVSIFLTGSTTVAVLYASGTFDDVYQLQARFDAAGQGLINDSDVKVRGVNIGEVDGVELDAAGRALVTMRIRGDEQIPVDAQATVRPKTLFGEKFVDIETTREGERVGPYLEDGDEIEHTLGSFELEEVLVGAQELLDAVEPADIGVILGTLASASSGVEADIRRQVQNWSAVADVFARRDAESRRFLDDFETLAGAFRRGSDDVVGLSRSLNQALPALNAQGDGLDDLLDDLADVSRHLAEVLERNQPTLVKMVTEGGKTLAVLHEHRERIPEVVVGLRDFARVLAQASLYEGNSFQVTEGGSGRAATIKFVSDASTLTALVCAKTGAHALCDALLPFLDQIGLSSGSVPPVRITGAGPVTRGVDAVVDLMTVNLTGVSTTATVEAVP